MKLSLIVSDRSNSPRHTDDTSAIEQELKSLCDRMLTNAHGDSDSVRQSILARMIYLQSEMLTKYFRTNQN